MRGDTLRHYSPCEGRSPSNKTWFLTEKRSRLHSPSSNIFSRRNHRSLPHYSPDRISRPLMSYKIRKSAIRRSPIRNRKPPQSAATALRAGPVCKKDALGANNFEQRVYSFGYGESFFSSRVPVQPMRIVLTGQPPQHVLQNQRMQRLLQNICNIEEQMSTDNKMDSSLPSPGNIGFITESSSPNSVAMVHRSCSPHMKNAYSTIQLLLREIITSLPLTTYRHVSTASTPLRKHNSRLTPGYLQTTSQSSVAYEPCNIGVQTFAYRKSVSATASNATTVITDRGTESSKEWVGGVRALRDLHVRLVLRQLRHIDKLNRALDNANSPEGIGTVTTKLTKRPKGTSAYQKKSKPVL